MATKPFYSILTRIGLAKETNASIFGNKAKWTHMAVGDGNGAVPSPAEDWTALVNEVYRGPINHLDKDPLDETRLVAVLPLPPSDGGFWIREVAIYDEDGDMVAIGSLPPLYKPSIEEGAVSDTVVQAIFKPSNVANIELKIDPAMVMATQSWTLERLAALAAWAEDNFSVFPATEALAGIARIATASEVDDGVNDDAIVTPKKLLAKLASALKNISGVPLGTILPIGVNFPTPQGFVNISYSQPSYHPVAGMAADFVAGYYCGDTKNDTAGFGYRCNNLDGTGRNVNGQYIAIEPAANRGYMGLDDTGEFDHFNVHEDQMQGFSPVASVAYGQSASIDSENAVGKPYRNRGGGVIPAIVGTSAWDAIATANDSHIWGTGYVVDDGVNGQVRMGKQTLPPRIYKKFIMKVADGAVGDPALVDWQAYLDAFTELSAIKVNYSDFTGDNQFFLADDAGYQKLPGGLILQWGRVANASAGVVAGSFPVTFPNAIISAQISSNASQTSGDYSNAWITTYSLSKISVYRSQGQTIGYFAIGF